MWIFKEVKINKVEDLPEKTHGFVYKIVYTDNTYYYGKKNLYRTVTLSLLKNGKSRPNATKIGKNESGKRVYYEQLIKQTDWLKYEGSCGGTEDLVIAYKEILEVAYSKRQLSYYEVMCLFQTESLEDPKCHNANILNSFFKDNLE